MAVCRFSGIRSAGLLIIKLSMPKNLRFQTPTGMSDILPEEQKYYKKIYDIVAEIADFYDFGKINTPVLENSDLFAKSIGASTDIVNKEMYSFKTKGGDSLALRPEWTAPISRAYIENGMQSLPQPVRLWYFGPCFRHERPQAGRYRQFWQFGFEVFGESDSVIDAQTIQIFYNIFKELKLKNIIVEINSMGDSNCRPYYKKLLANYLKTNEFALCVDCRKRARENVLRILDCKEGKCQPIKNQAPQILDHLCDECKTRFKQVLEFLDEIELPYILNPYLVRGLDYYTKTVFEIFTGSNESNGQGPQALAGGLALQRLEPQALAGGGRYDKLVKLLGGRDIPACGGAAGIERIVKLLKAQDEGPQKRAEVSIFLAQLGDLAKRKCLKIFEEFRKANIRAAESLGKDSLKSQLNKANRLGVRYSLILGHKEALEGIIIIKNMETGKQETIKLDKAVEEIKKRLKK